MAPETVSIDEVCPISVVSAAAGKAIASEPDVSIDAVCYISVASTAGATASEPDEDSFFGRS